MMRCLRFLIAFAALGFHTVLSIQQDCSDTELTSLLGADVSQESSDGDLLLLQTTLSLSKVQQHEAYTHANASLPLDNHSSRGHVSQSDSMKATGIKFNSAGDLAVFGSTLVSAICSFAFMVAVFALCSKLYPCMYSNNVTIKMAPIDIPAGIFGWIKASLAVMPDREAKAKLIDAIGLDCVMLLEFTELCMKICVVLGIPLLLFLAPMHAFFGGHATAFSHDSLSIFSFGNVENDSWLYWIHAVVVWGVVLAVTRVVNDAQTKFMSLRYEWLSKMPEPRSTTLLVTHIPEDYQSDARLQEYFAKLFPETGPQTGIKSAYVAKNTTKLLAMIEQQKTNIRSMEQAEAQHEKTGDRPKLRNGNDEIDFRNEQIKELDGVIAEERKRIAALSLQVAGEVNCPAGFITFNSSIDAQTAIHFDFSPDGEQSQWIVDNPPEQSTVVWSDMMQSHTKRKAYSLLGYLLTAGLYLAYLPIVVGISQICARINMGPFDSLWKGFAPTVGLQCMVSFLPTILILIFRGCFTLYDDLKAQWVLQNWYFLFQVVFILLVTAISGSIFQFMKLCVENPFGIPSYLGNTMPFATHFYMNFLMTQWVTHGMNLTRYVYIAKFLVFRKVYHDEEVARELSEPEDQDYYGIGSRSSRFTIMMCIAIIYGTLCPPMIILCFINFLIARVVYGYLMTFAETKKGDMGGDCWVSCLEGLFSGMMIYVVVMAGVLYGRSTSKTPSMIAFACLLYVISARIDFTTKFQWKHLPYPMLKSSSDPKAMQKQASGAEYCQDELVIDTDTFRRKSSSSVK